MFIVWLPDGEKLRILLESREYWNLTKRLLAP